jgi:hypothetical protein
MISLTKNMYLYRMIYYPEYSMDYNSKYSNFYCDEFIHFFLF